MLNGVEEIQRSHANQEIAESEKIAAEYSASTGAQSQCCCSDCAIRESLI
jgi:hypothetical protein